MGLCGRVRWDGGKSVWWGRVGVDMGARVGVGVGVGVCSG